MKVMTRVAPAVPGRVLAAAIRTTYPRYEPELRRISEYFSSGRTALDVGAWYGPWTVKLARRAQRVISFEPMPGVAAVLRKGLPANVEVVQSAVADQDGQAEVWAPAAGRGMEGVSSMTRRSPDAVPVAVRQVAVDGLGLEDVDFMKVDVEGHELGVLQGAEKTIARDRPVILLELETRMQDVRPVCDLMGEWGYTGWVLPAEKWTPLADFDLAGHQQRTAHVVDRGLLRRTIRPLPRYVNSVLFLPDDRVPGVRAAQSGGRG
jgi:FkbM family methyltransferase